jgi:predicted alpha/beta superfamily hydrolase
MYIQQFLRFMSAATIFCFFNLSQANSISPFGHPPFETVPIHAKSNKKDYELYIQLPKTYHDSKTYYPVIIVMDTSWGFPITNGAMTLMGGNVVKEAIVVGVSYSKGDDRTISRTRDYTPTHSPNEPKGHSSDARKVSGQASAYTAFLADELIPMLIKNYRIDINNKIFVGHSFGGLLGSYILVNRPNVFDHYIIGSPSLWYDDRVIFKMEKTYSETHKSLNANVLIYVDDNKGSVTDQKMANDTKEFERILTSRNYSGLRVKAEIIKGENHHSVFPGLVAKGLMESIPLTQ